MKIRRIEVEGFGPFADRQVLEFPEEPGVTVVYGENMRGKTSLLNAIRYAFFGTVVGRGSRERLAHTVTNRERAAVGKFGFSVTLTFEHDGTTYELVRECRPRVMLPASNDDYVHEVEVRRGNMVLGPNEAPRALTRAFPKDVSRFFLFDGELLQEYEELLHNDKEEGRKISEAIERILGLPILKRGKVHLGTMLAQADLEAGQAASRHKETEGVGAALQLATKVRQGHVEELARKQADLKILTEEKLEAEARVKSVAKYRSLVEARERAVQRKQDAAVEERKAGVELVPLMDEAWRTLLGPQVHKARLSVQQLAKVQADALAGELRKKAADHGECDVCLQPVANEARSRLQSMVLDTSDTPESLSNAMARLSDLMRFKDRDVAGEVRQLAKGLHVLELERASLDSEIRELSAKVSDSDRETLRRSDRTYQEVIAQSEVVKKSIEQQEEKVREQDEAIVRFNRKLAKSDLVDLRLSQGRVTILRAATDVFTQAVERYKGDLRQRVEATASDLFLAMTTEKRDYAGLTINEHYGLTIRHRDGKAEDARSAGAEHVVALALMGALQQNAPLRGPIVMDSPFGRLDDGHTTNVVQALPSMAEQVVLLVYEAEVGRQRMRQLLGPNLRREYELEHVSARRTNIRLVQ